jgi:hypothetical protein
VASVSSKVRGIYKQMYDRAVAPLKRNPDGSYVEEEVQEALAAIIRAKTDPEVLIKHKVRAVLAKLSQQPGEGEEDDDAGPYSQLSLFGDAWSFDPTRLVKDSRGNIIDYDQATLPFILADLARSSQNMLRISTWQNRKSQLALHYQAWVQSQIDAGIDPRTLTLGKCIRETGLLKPKKPS